MSVSIENISLDQLQENITDRKETFFRQILSVTKQSSDEISSFLNHLFEEYNKLCSANKRREEVMQYHPYLYEAFTWFLPFLDTFHKIVLYTNLCIISDDISDSEFHEEHFETCLKHATCFADQCVQKVYSDCNDLHNNEKRLLCEALYSLGYLNLREHNYESASKCFRPCVIILSSFIETREEADLYLKSIVHLANSFEYNEMPLHALKYMLDLPYSEESLSKDDNNAAIEWVKKIDSESKAISELIEQYYRDPNNREFESPIKGKDYSIATVRDVCKKLCLSSSEITERVFDLDGKDKEINETVKLYLHVLAHCISEYAAKIRKTNFTFPACSTLQLVSRFLLDWLVASCKEATLVSCQATVRAENDACPEAISLLLQRYYQLKDQEPILPEYEKELKELSFFLFYFSEQELRFNYDDDKLRSIFKNFGDEFRRSAEQIKDEMDQKRRDRYDPLFHYYVIQFKHLFKRAAEQLLERAVSESSEETANQSEIDYVFAQMCKYEAVCSKRIFKGLRKECERLKRLYTIFRILCRLDGDSCQLSDLDELSRVLSYAHVKDPVFLTGDQMSYEKVLNDLYGEIIKRNKILILAPVEDAPSCSSEYQELGKLLTFSIDSTKTDLVSNPWLDYYGTVIKDQDTRTIHLKSINSDSSYSNLKWAVYIDNASNTTGTYLYVKRNDIENIGYRAAIPIFLEGREIDELKKIISVLETRLVSSQTIVRRNRNQTRCPRAEHDREFGRICCTHQITVSERNKELLQCVTDLLVFFEFDFFAAATYPISENDVLLICNPNTNSHNFFSVLAFEKELPQVSSDKGLCSLCESFCVEYQTPLNSHKEGEFDASADTATAGDRSFCSKEFNQENCQKVLDQLCNKRKVAEESQNKDDLSRYIETIQNSCLCGACKKSQNEDKCYVLSATRKWSLEL